MHIQRVSLRDYTSLHIGGDADMVIVRSEDELVKVILSAKEKSRPVHILGEGTNTYFGENLKNLLVLKMEIKGIGYDVSSNVLLENSEGCRYVTIGAGECWDDLVRESVEKGLWGLENLSLIPGTVGAAPVQNIGAYGVELCDIFVSARVYDFEKNSFIVLSKEQCSFGYRDSLFKREIGRYSITSVTLALSNKPKPILDYKPLDTLIGTPSVTPKIVRDLVIKTRTEKLPDYKEYPNAGSFFKNPVISEMEGDALRATYPDIPLHSVSGGYKVPAAWLIEHIALMKGVKIGDLGTWSHQPLVVVNYGSSTSDDIMVFTHMVIEKIRQKTGILLEREVNCIV
jgi:UDP-N-acetylmuramate dehydrogenase